MPKIGIRTDAAVCGIAGLAFLGGSYMAEAFRSGLESIEPIQTESAYSLGMDQMQTMRYVILPQAMSTSVPAFVTNVIFLLKETSVFSAISLMDLMFTAKDLIGLYYKTTESLFLLVVFYLLILLPVSLLGSLLERRLRYAGLGLTYCSRAKTWPACWAACGWPCASACFRRHQHPAGHPAGRADERQKSRCKSHPAGLSRNHPHYAADGAAVPCVFRPDPCVGLGLSGETASVIVFVLWGTAEMSDLVRGALISIPKHQYESSEALGLTKAQTYWYIVIPQTVRRLIR